MDRTGEKTNELVTASPAVDQGRRSDISAAVALSAVIVLLVFVVWQVIRALERSAFESTAFESNAAGSSTVASHAGSWAVLIIGLLLAACSYFLAMSVQAQRATRADLDETMQDGLVDELTGLWNRTGIAANIERRLDERQPSELVAVFFCDLDRLKVVNDSLGHMAGDEVLRVAAQRLSTIVREQDSIGRFGGDEFVIVSSGLPTIRDLEILAGRLTQSLQEPTVLADSSVQVVSGSIGVAWVGGGDVASPGELLRDADVAMYRAKQDGGARYTMFDSSLRAQAVARLEMEQELRKGVRDGQILVHYQPIVGAKSGATDRFEALIRWDHPQRGIIRPSDFLPVAAESQLIVELGETVLVEACRQAVRWTEEAGRPITIAVIIAERQLLDLTLVDSVTRVLAACGLPPAQLELEITEELIMERVDQSLIVLRQLDLIGVCLAIDDFGTSQASLSQLKKLAMVSTLKIDRLFVDGIGNDEVDRKIVAAIVALANSVGMSVVAEGVETEQQAQILSDLGVQHLQGFLFGRPGSAEALNPALSGG